MYRTVARVLFVAGFIFGLWVNRHSWGGKLFVYVGEHRAPAAVRTLEEYSSLDREALSRTAEAQLMAYAEVTQDDGQLGFTLGHPLLTRDDGFRQFSCEVRDQPGVYDRIQITFVASGIAEGGEPPKMTVDSHCHSGDDLNRLDTVWIPMNEIVTKQMRDGDFDLGDEGATHVKFSNMPDSWPETWVLWSVRLYRADGSFEPLLIGTQQLRANETKLMSFDWKTN